jgi:hypothetical protein
MIRIVIGVALVIWAIVVWLNNYDFWDGFVFPTAASSGGVYLILSGREKLIGESGGSQTPSSNPDPSETPPRSSTAASTPLPPPPQPGSSTTTSGESVAQKIVIGIATSVFSALIIKLLGGS